MVCPREYICAHRTPTTQKFEQKALFSSRLAGVNAQTSRNVKMKILADFIKRTCNRFNIDPKDIIDDPESPKQSKSSSRAPAEYDENEDVLALDTTKRCNNGQDYLVRTYQGRVETEDIKKYLVELQQGYFYRKRKERNISLRGSRFGGTYEHMRCRDYRKPTFCPCIIKIVRTKNDGGKDETSVYKIADHNHDRMSAPRVGLDDGMKKKAAAWYKSGYSAAMAALHMSVFDMKTRKKIRNYVGNYRHDILDLKGEVETEEGWRETFKEYFPENLPRGFFTKSKFKHSPFVLSFQAATATDDLVISFSTPSLMQNMVKTFDKGLRVIQMDGTYKLNNKGYPLIIIGTADRERQLFESVFCITKSEKESSFKAVASAIEEHCAKYLKTEYQSCTRLHTVSDAHGSYRNTYTKLARAKDTPFVLDTTTIGMCYFHVKQSIPDKVAGGREHKEDIDVLAYVPAGYTSLFRNLYGLFKAKWLPKAKAFFSKFDKTWRDKFWSRAFLRPGMPQTNNAAESKNKHLKNMPICKIRPSVCDSALRLLQEISAMSRKLELKKFHANEDDRDYTPIEVNDAVVFKSKLERNGNFLFPFWEDGNMKDDIPEAVVFCRSGLIKRITNKYSLDTYEMEGIRDGEDTNNAIRPLLQEQAKRCYLTWLYIDNNDGKLPDDFQSFDDWKQFISDFYICRKLSKENIPKSGIPYSCMCTEWRRGEPIGYQQTCKCKHVYTAARIFAQHIVPEKVRQHIKANKKRGRPAKRKRALEYQPGEMPSPEKVSKEARVEEIDDEDFFEDAFEACL